MRRPLAGMLSKRWRMQRTFTLTNESGPCPCSQHSRTILHRHGGGGLEREGGPDDRPAWARTVPQTPTFPGRTLTVASTAARLRLSGVKTIATASFRPTTLPDHARHGGILPNSASRAPYNAREVPAGSPSNSRIIRLSKYVILLRRCPSARCAASLSRRRRIGSSVRGRLFCNPHSCRNSQPRGTGSHLPCSDRTSVARSLCFFL